jgi:hypothetical protein
MARVKSYRSSDRAHVSVKWTKAERAQWDADSRETAERVRGYIDRNDCRSAYAGLSHLAGLRSHGITTGAHLDVERAFLKNCLLTSSRGLSGAKKRRR